MEEIIAMLQSAQIDGGYFLSPEGVDNWQPLSSIGELQAFIPAPPPVVNTPPAYNAPPAQGDLNAAVTPRQQPPLKIRHGFTSFWLWLNLVLYGISALLLIFVPEISLFLFGSDPGFETRLVLGGLVGGLAAWGIIYMLGWNRWGFWLFALGALVNEFFAAIVLGANTSADLKPFMISTLISVAIMFGVLRIRNIFGLTTDEQMHGGLRDALPEAGRQFLKLFEMIDKALEEKRKFSFPKSIKVYASIAAGILFLAVICVVLQEEHDVSVPFVIISALIFYFLAILVYSFTDYLTAEDGGSSVFAVIIFEFIGAMIFCLINLG